MRLSHKTVSKQFIPLFLILYLCGACNPVQEAFKSFDAITDIPQTLEGTRMYSDSTYWGGSLHDLIGKMLIVDGAKDGYMFLTYQLTHDSMINRGNLIKQGIGPYEMLSPRYFSDHLTDNIYFYDQRGMNFNTLYSTNMITNSRIQDPTTWKKMSVPVRNHFWWGVQHGSITALNDTTFIGLGGDVEGENIFSLFYADTDTIIELDTPFPADNNHSDPIIKRGIYNSGKLIRRKSSRQVLYCCFPYGHYAEIITVNEDKTVNRNVLINNYASYQPDPQNLNPKFEENTKMGIKSYVTNKYIYLLPSHLTIQDVRKNTTGYKGYDKFFDDQIYVFDWNGFFVKSYLLDTPISTFVVDENDSFLLGSTEDIHNGEPYVRKFRLK